MLDLLIPRSQLERMDRHATECRPEEGCGLLLGLRRGSTKTIHEVVPTPNIHDGDRHRAYTLDPSVLAEALHCTRSQVGKLLGFFHSHPASEPLPSATDEGLAWPDLSYFILGRVGEDSWKARSWRWVGSRRSFVEEKVTVIREVGIS